MSDVKDINDHIVNTVDGGDTLIVEYDPAFHPGTDPVLTVTAAIHKTEDPDTPWLFGISHDQAEDGEVTEVPVTVVLEAALAMYLGTAQQLTQGLPEPVRKSYDASLLESLQGAHQQFLDAVDHFRSISGEVMEMLALIEAGEDPSAIIDGLTKLAQSPDGDAPEATKE